MTVHELSTCLGRRRQHPLCRPYPSSATSERPLLLEAIVTPTLVSLSVRLLFHERLDQLLIVRERTP